MIWHAYVCLVFCQPDLHVCVLVYEIKKQMQAIYTRQSQDQFLVDKNYKNSSFPSQKLKKKIVILYNGFWCQSILVQEAEKDHTTSLNEW